MEEEFELIEVCDGVSWEVFDWCDDGGSLIRPFNYVVNVEIA